MCLFFSMLISMSHCIFYLLSGTFSVYFFIHCLLSIISVMSLSFCFILCIRSTLSLSLSLSLTILLLSLFFYLLYTIPIFPIILSSFSLSLSLTPPLCRTLSIFMSLSPFISPSLYLNCKGKRFWQRCQVLVFLLHSSAFLTYISNKSFLRFVSFNFTPYSKGGLERITKIDRHLE